MQPTTGGSPSNPGTASWTITGIVRVHDRNGVAAAAGGHLFGWVERGGGGRTTGPVQIGPDGRYRFNVDADTTNVSVFGGPGHQPCAVSFSPGGDFSANVDRIVDQEQLGANVPAALTAQTPTLSGQVYEQTPAGRRPIAAASVILDGLEGFGVIVADTLTDADGRYVLCGVPQRPKTALTVSSSGFQIRDLFNADIAGRSVVDIELTPIRPRP